MKHKETAEYFNDNGYLVLSGVLPKETCKQLTEYLFDLHRNGKMVRDDQCPLSDSVYGDPILDEILGNLAKPLGDHIGKKLLPTYTYARIYRTGEELKKHVDRPACEISGTLTLGFDAKHVWRIFFDDKKEIGIDQEVGDLVMYKGCDVIHWRPPFKGNWQAQVFFHFVDADGPNANQVKDGREKLGITRQAKVESPPPTNKQQEIVYAKPIFDGVMIPSTDFAFPGYYCVDQYNMPELMFTEEECNKLLTIVKETYPQAAGVGGVQNAGTIAKSIRSADIYSVVNDSDNRWVYEKLAKIVSCVNSVHFDYYLLGLTHDIQLIHYSSDTEIKGHYDWHIDSGPGHSATRKISVVVQLSDPQDYEECALTINNHATEVIATKQRGSVHLFPSYMLHRVTPIIKGNRYALVTWVHGSGRFR